MLPQPSVEDIVCKLQKCRKEPSQAHVLVRIHSYMCRYAFDTHISLGNYLVSMLAQVGNMQDAREAFDKLPVRNVVSWTAIIGGYAKDGHGEEALECFEKMQLEAVRPDAVALVCCLKACSCTGAMTTGQEIHMEIERQGLLKVKLAVGNALVHMYAKCGALTKSQEVFDMLPLRDVASWTTLIAGYAEFGDGKKALETFEKMQLKGVSPNDVTFVCGLKACGIIRAALEGQQIHTEIEWRSLLEKNLVIGNALVDMYAKCGLLIEAQQLFDKLIVRDVVSWNALIGGYTEHGHGTDALRLFQQMQLMQVSPNSVTFACSLKACAIIGAIDTGQEMHVEIARRGSMERDAVVGSTLVDMYVESGSLTKAREVFEKLPVRNVLTWNGLISGYVEYGHGEEALKCFEKMQVAGISPDAVTLVSCLKACICMGATRKGEELHGEIESMGLLQRDLVVGTTLVDIYAKQGLLEKAQQVFDKLGVRNAVTWNSLIEGYAKHEHAIKALDCFEQMQLEGVSPNATTFVYSLNACSSIRAVDRGHYIHTEVSRNALLEKAIHVGGSLVDMYAKCGYLVKAREVFDQFLIQNVVLWNALITGYTENGYGIEAIKCFDKMQMDGVSPDVVTFLSILKACGSIGAIDEGVDVHATISKNGFLEKDVIGNALVDMYVKCSMLAKAQDMFDNVLFRSSVTWNTLLMGYAEHEQAEEALVCFERMQNEGVTPNSVTFIFGLKACGTVGAMGKGKEIHTEIEKRGLFDEDLVGTSLVSMYCKCGSLAMAQQVFDKLHATSIVSWNLLIAGYARQGESKTVFCIFQKMLEEGTEPDYVTFIVVLNVCSLTGLYDEGQSYIDAMCKDHGIAPTLKHHTCIVDLLGRAGELDKLVRRVRKLPLCPDLVVWHTVLDACMKWGNVELGRRAFEHALRLHKEDGASCFSM